MEEFDDIIQLYFYPDINRFVDCGGYIVDDIFSFITTRDLFLFKYHKEYTLVQHAYTPRLGIELMYPDPEDGDWEGYNYNGYI